MRDFAIFGEILLIWVKSKHKLDFLNAFNQFREIPGNSRPGFQGCCIPGNSREFPFGHEMNLNIPIREFPVALTAVLLESWYRSRSRSRTALFPLSLL